MNSKDSTYESRTNKAGHLLKYAVIAVMAIGFYAAPLSPELGSDLAMAAENENVITLPEPDKSGGAPLMKALADRKTTRSFSNKEVSMQDVSNLLWAAWGINRDDGKHTTPTARNKQRVAVYAVLESGVWFYEPKTHSLHLALKQDARSKFNAPFSLLYATPDDKERYGAMHVGSMYQNVGLYCASAGLGNVVKGSGVNALKGSLPLPEGYSVQIVHSIGWPK